MKVLLRISAGLLLFATMSVPAWAALDIKGHIFVDSYYYHQDAEGFSRPYYTSLKTHPGSGGVAGVPVGSTLPRPQDRKQTFFELNHSTALRFHWTNEQGLGAFIATYMNPEPAQAAGTDSGFKVGVSTAFLYYDIIKDLRLTVGIGGFTQVFSPFDPSTIMGYDGVCKVRGLGFGNINSSYQNNIRLTYKLPMIASLDIAFIAPKMTGDTETGFVPIGQGVLPGGADLTAIDNISRIPKIEVGIPMVIGGKWGHVRVTPSAMYLKQKFANVASGDSSIESYGLSLGASANIYGVKLSAEYNYGQNLWNAAKNGQATCYPFKFEYIAGGMRSGMAARVLNGQMYDSKTEAFWVQLGYDIHKIIEPTIIYGQSRTKRDMPGMGVGGYGNTNFTTKMYGFNMPIKIKPNFHVVPEFMVYDSGNANEINGNVLDFGKEWLAGVQWRLFF